MQTTAFANHRVLVLIGAMKAGTTSLYHHLKYHPAIFMAHIKEPQFFSRDPVYNRGIDWYASLFAGATNDHVLGEASTCYSRLAKYPCSAERIHKHLPHARLLYLLRHPVDRLYSHYAHSMEEAVLNGAQPISFDDFVRQDEEAMNASDYMFQIELYSRLFASDKIRCVVFDDLLIDPTSIMRDILDFVELDFANVVARPRLHENSRGTKLAEQIVDREFLRIRNSAPLKFVVDAFPKWVRRPLKKVVVNQLLVRSPFGKRKRSQFVQSLSKMSPECKRQLCSHFAPSVKRLEQFLGRRLDGWFE